MTDETQAQIVPQLISQQSADVVQIPRASETSAILHMIERAARDPAVDVDKLQRLLEMRDQVEARAAQRAFDGDMALAQAEMRPVAKDAENPQTRSRYATYFALDQSVRPIYTAHGFALSFDTDPTAASGTDMLMLCYVSHRGGHNRTYRLPMPADGKGARGGDVMTRTHAAGSAMTYGRRYMLQGIFNLAIGGDSSDDDGMRAGRRPPPRPAPNVMRPPPHDPETGEILEERTSLADSNPPAGGEAPAGPAEYRPPAGATKEWKELDAELAAAAEQGRAVLAMTWYKLSRAEQGLMNARKESHHKPRSEAVDEERIAARDNAAESGSDQ